MRTPDDALRRGLGRLGVDEAVREQPTRSSKHGAMGSARARTLLKQKILRLQKSVYPLSLGPRAPWTAQRWTATQYFRCSISKHDKRFQDGYWHELSSYI